MATALGEGSAEMTVSELIAKLQLEDPAAEVVTRGICCLDKVMRVRELMPVELRRFAVKSCVWFEYWTDVGPPPQDDRKVVFSEPVKGVLLE